MDTILVGNIGIPVFDHMEEVGPDTRIVCELSCHQLEYMTVSPHIAILTNLHEEHLDHYGTLENMCRQSVIFIQTRRRETFLYAMCSVCQRREPAPLS